jgi:hypothetical protein
MADRIYDRNFAGSRFITTTIATKAGDAFQFLGSAAQPIAASI